MMYLAGDAERQTVFLKKARLYCSKTIAVPINHAEILAINRNRCVVNLLLNYKL